MRTLAKTVLRWPVATIVVVVALTAVFGAFASQAVIEDGAAVDNALTAAPVHPLMAAAYPAVFLFATNAAEQTTLDPLWRPLLLSVLGAATLLAEDWGGASIARTAAALATATALGALVVVMGLLGATGGFMFNPLGWTMNVFADAGFEPQVGFRKQEAGAGYNWWGDEEDWWARLQLNGNWDIAHDDDGRLLETLDMAPCDADPCPLYTPGVTYRYALEVNQGFYTERGITADWRLDIDRALGPS